jgi:hypothetical protein
MEGIFFLITPLLKLSQRSPPPVAVKSLLYAAFEPFPGGKVRSLSGQAQDYFSMKKG